MSKKNLTISDIRYRNARLLQESVGGQTGMIEKTGRSQAQISHLIGENPIKSIGHNIARALEQDFKKPAGWLDTPQWIEPGDEEKSRLRAKIDRLAGDDVRKAMEVLKVLFPD